MTALFSKCCLWLPQRQFLVPIPPCRLFLVHLPCLPQFFTCQSAWICQSIFCLYYSFCWGSQISFYYTWNIISIPYQGQQAGLWPKPSLAPHHSLGCLLLFSHISLPFSLPMPSLFPHNTHGLCFSICLDYSCCSSSHNWLHLVFHILTSMHLPFNRKIIWPALKLLSLTRSSIPCRGSYIMLQKIGILDYRIFSQSCWKCCVTVRYICYLSYIMTKSKFKFT